VNSVVICNGKFFGGGMMVGPHAALDDGKFDVIVIGDFGRLEVIVNTPRLYNGTILTHPKVKEYRGTMVSVESKQRMLIEADGELIGEGPATFRLLPAALKLLV
jgi:diacylglycerol kinase (ATP)